MAESSTRLLILDDDRDVACAAQILLRRRHGAVATLDDPAHLEALLADGVPDVVLLDLRLPDIDGYTVARQLRARSNVPIIVVTAMRNAAILNKLLAKRVSAIVEKAGGINELQSALVAVAQGRSYVSPGVEALLARMSLIGKHLGNEASLTTAELEVVRLFAHEKLPAKLIAERLNRSVKTISAHKMRAQRKLGLSTSQELIEYWQTRDPYSS